MPVVILAGLALHLPAVNMGFFSDDYGHQIILQGISQHQNLRPWNLYDFGVYPRPEDEAWDAGLFPWWTPRDWKGRFFRPLTSCTLWLDHTLFGGWSPGYHLTSLVWYALLLLLTYALFRSLALPPRAALLGIALLAASDATVFNVGWPANRNGLLAVTFMVASVLTLTRHRTWGRWPTLTCALLLATLACLAKESGVSAFAMIAAYLLWQWRGGSGDVRSWAVAGSALSIALAAGYVLFLVVSGFGTNTLFYSPPWGDPLGYITRMGKLLSFGMFSMLTPLSTDLLLGLPWSRWLTGAVCLGVVLAVVRIMWPTLRAHAATPFLIAWVVLALLPQGGAPPSGRLLLGVRVGSAGLLAIFIYRAVFDKASVERPQAGRALGIALFITACLLSTLNVAVSSRFGARMAGRLRETVLTAEMPPEGRPYREIFILQPPDQVVSLGLIWTWTIETGDRTVRFWPMQAGTRGLRWTRIDERTFTLTTLDRPFLTCLMERVFVVSRRPPSPGTNWRTALFEVEAVESGPGGLRSFRVTCPESLEAPHYVFLVTREMKLVAVPPPKVGETVELPAGKPITWFAD